MTSREKILAAVKNNQPALLDLPTLNDEGAVQYEDKFAQFTAVLKGIGGTVVEITNTKEIVDYVHYTFENNQNFVTTIPGLDSIKMLDETLDAHFLENIEVAIVKALFGVAENGSVWLTDEEMKIRALPFICQHLSVVLNKTDLVNNMQQAYQLIRDSNYEFGAFIAGPSKTADIEQSLVLGAHGPKTMTVFVLV
jgi:L-lactate dehydrogenase complex protein LldG